MNSIWGARINWSTSVCTPNSRGSADVTYPSEPLIYIKKKNPVLDPWGLSQHMFPGLPHTHSRSCFCFVFQTPLWSPPLAPPPLSQLYVSMVPSSPTTILEIKVCSECYRLSLASFKFSQASIYCWELTFPLWYCSWKSGVVLSEYSSYGSCSFSPRWSVTSNLIPNRRSLSVSCLDPRCYTQFSFSLIIIHFHSVLGRPVKIGSLEQFNLYSSI